jgi:hypothetical protein
MSPRSSRTTVPGRRPRATRRQGEQPVDVLDCQSCDRPAIEIFAPVVCKAMEDAHVLCPRCNEGAALVVRWHFVVPATPHPVLGMAENARIRAVRGAYLDMSGSRVTLLP